MAMTKMYAMWLCLALLFDGLSVGASGTRITLSLNAIPCSSLALVASVLTLFGVI